MGALEKRPEEVREPRSWLAATLRRGWSKSLRGMRHRSDREREAARPQSSDPLTDTLEREEARRVLLNALATLEQPYRSCLLLRYFEGLPPRRIAKRLDLPVETVKTRIKRGLAQLRARLDDGTDGGRATWALALAPLALSGPAVPLLPVFDTLLELLIMSTKTKLALTAAALLGIVLVTARLWPETSNRSAGPEVVHGEVVNAAELAEPETEPELELAEAPSHEVERVEVQPAETVVPEAKKLLTHGSVSGLVLWHDGTPAAGVAATVIAWNMPSPRYNALEAMTSADGRFHFERVLAGRIVARTGRGGHTRAEVEAGEEIKVVIELPRGFDVKGTVVDGEGAPVADADIAFSGMSPRSARVVTQSDAQGRFGLRSVGDGLVWVGATAPGYAPSPMPTLTGAEGAEVPVELVLDVRGGEVSGLVLDPSGEPVPGAAVYADTPQKRRGSAWAPAPLRSFTDEEGRYRELSVAPGECQITVRTMGFAPWHGTVEVREGVLSELDVQLVEGVDVHGIASDGQGNAARRVEVSVQSNGRLEQMVIAGDDGSYRLPDLEPGTFEIYANGDERGRAQATLSGEPGDSIEWNFQLASLQLAGRVTDEEGTPLEGWTLRLQSTSFENHHFAFATTDAEGRFLFEGCQDRDYGIDVEAAGSRFASLSVKDVHPPADDLLLRVPLDRVPSVRIVGTVLDADRKPAKTASLGVSSWRFTNSPIVHVDENGRFEFGPLPPGKWSVSVRTPDRPSFRTESRDLAADEIWDVGTIHIDDEGSFRANLVRDAAAPDGAPSVSLRHEGGYTRDLMQVDGDEVWADALAPGNYTLIVEGEGFAATLHRFEIQNGEQTTFDLALRTGVESRLRADVGEDAKLVHVAVIGQDNQHVIDQWLRPGDEHAIDHTMWLEPGTYRVVLETPEGRESEGALEVTANPPEAPTLQLDL